MYVCWCVGLLYSWMGVGLFWLGSVDRAKESTKPFRTHMKSGYDDKDTLDTGNNISLCVYGHVIEDSKLY